MSILKCMLEILLISFSFEQCYPNCEDCIDFSYESKDMKCTSCIAGFFFIFNTSNCEEKSKFPNYYLNKTDNILYPCSFFAERHCYECDPYLDTKGICLSCERGYEYNKDTNECEQCGENEYSIILSDFDNCFYYCNYGYCDKYITFCDLIENDETICPDNAPIFDYITKSCNEYECINSGLKKDVCYPYNKKYIDRILFINWFNDTEKYFRYPNFLRDNSDLLLIELSYESTFNRGLNTLSKTKKRKFYFYNEEGRGLFDEINDIYEKSVNIDKKMLRYYSSSIIFKLNNTEENIFFLNIENGNYNIEFFNIKTGEISFDNIIEIIIMNSILRVGISPWIQLLKLNEDNKFLFVSYFHLYFDTDTNSGYELRLIFLNFEFNPSKKEIINIYSLEEGEFYSYDFKNYDIYINDEERFFIIQTKSGYLYYTLISDEYELFLISESESGNLKSIENFEFLFKDAFHKLLFIKEEIFLLCYYSNTNYLYYYNFSLIVIENKGDGDQDKLIELSFKTNKKEGGYNADSDIIVLSETKIAFLIRKLNGRGISIYIFDFFDKYTNYIMNKFYINLYEQKMDFSEKYFLIFKYKDILGFHIENIEGETGFILFGYYNSTDPKQIYNVKKDGLNYIINLGDYLTLQSNIFEYEKKCIKIVEIPDLNSGLYLISNITKNIITKNDCINLNTKISLNFANNGIIKKGNYLFKFCGVVEEPTFETIAEYSDDFYSTDQNNFQKYNEQRNTNITGKVALVQINVLNDTKVFCDNEYNDTALKAENGTLITCGNKKFYEVENSNEITQINLGHKYYFDTNKNVYIKCHEKCKKCSKEYNDTNMNCDECYENYFLRDGLCLEISKCQYNYYYDNNLNLICINKDTYCPDFKPYENNMSHIALPKNVLKNVILMI